MHRSNRNEQLEALMEEYLIATGNNGNPTMGEVAQWAIDTEKYVEPKERQVSKLASDLGRALRETHVSDPQGRRIRKYYAYKSEDKSKQGYLWADFSKITPKQMSSAVQLRRRQIVDDCKQLKTDVDSFNENRKLVPQIQLCLDFTQDIEELTMSTVYAPAAI
jgi:hypothetical protein